MALSFSNLDCSKGRRLFQEKETTDFPMRFPFPNSRSRNAPSPSFLATFSGRRKLQDGSHSGRDLGRNGHQMQCHLPAQDLTLRSGQPEMLLPQPHPHASAFTCPRNELCPPHPLSAAVRRGALCVWASHPCHLGVEPRNTLVHLILKPKTAHSLSP